MANLVKQGRTTKEIARLMHVTTKTIDSHRKRVRKKMNLREKKANLRSHLLCIE